MMDIDGLDIDIKLLTPLTRRDINLKKNNGYKNTIESFAEKESVKRNVQPQAMAVVMHMLKNVMKH